MSIQLNHSDFQCLQDQLVDLKTKNYELAEKNRRGQADFEAAKAKICSLQLKLEEQERDFQVTSTTLRREIEIAYNTNNRDTSTSNVNNNDGDENNEPGGDYRAKYKKLLHKAKELQLRYDKSVEVVKQMDDQIAELTSKSASLEEENSRQKQALQESQATIATSQGEYQAKLESAVDEFKRNATHDCQEHIDKLNAIKLERDSLQKEIESLRTELKDYQVRVESQSEERKIQDRKGAQMIKELKRQLALEKNRNETIQKRLESLLATSEVPTTSTGPDQAYLESQAQLSTSSSNTNGNSRGSRSAANGQARDDNNSVSSWSLVPGKTASTSSMCSMDSGDRETVHLPSNNVECDTSSSQQALDSNSQARSPVKDKLHNSSSITSPNKHNKSSSSLSQTSMGDTIESQFAYDKRANSTQLNYSTATESSQPGLKFEDQAALMERVTRLQHDKWNLEEKVSYMEQANAALAQDLADKSHIIRHYFMEQAVKSSSASNQPFGMHNDHSAMRDPSGSRRTSFPNNINQLLTDTPSLKKMVDFLKERSQVSGGESESITREATKKMQVMLEETLIKCLKLQENLDYVTSELNKLQT